MRTVTVELRALVDNYVAGLKRAAQATTDLADKAGKKLTEHSAEVSRMGTGFMVAGAGMIAAVAKATKVYADFDKAMSAVAATGDDAKASLSGLRTLAIDLGADTQYSAEEAAQGITNLLKAGVSAQDVIGGGLAGALNLAAAGQIEVADAAEVTAISLTQFGLAGDKASHVADLLAAGAGKAAGEVSDMAAALRQSGLVANQTGLTIEETTGTLAAFASAGLLGSDAGTSLKTMLQRLTPQSAEAQKQLDQLGISAYDSAGKFVGMADFAGQLHDKLSKLTPEARNSALAVIFGSDAVRAATVLYDKGADGIQTWIDAVNDQGYASRQAAELTNNLAGDVERLGGSLDSVFIRSGSGANQVLRNLVQGAEAAVDAIGQLPEPLLSTMTLLTGAGGIATLGVGGLLKLAAAAADARANFKALGLSAKTAKLAIGGVGGLLTIGTIALTAWASSAADAEARTQGFLTTLALIDGKAVTTQATLTELVQQLTETRTGMLAWTGVGATVADNLDRMGISSGLAAKAILGQADAQTELSAKMRAWADANRGMHGNDPQAYYETRDAIDAMAGGLDNAKRRAEQKAQADQDAAGSSANLSAALRDQHSGADSAATSIQKVTEAIYGLQDANLAIAGSQVSFEQAIDDSAAAVKKLLKATKDKADLQNVDKQAGRDAITTLTRLALATNSYAKEQIKQGKSESDIAATMSRGRKVFAERARDLGFSEKKISDLIAKYLQVPENVTTDVNEQGAEGAQARVNNLFTALKKLPKSQQTKILSLFNNSGIKAAESALNKINGKTATTTVTTIYRSKGGDRKFTAAEGGTFRPSLAGLIQEFAAGGFGQPQVRPFQGSAGVRWGEEGSGPWEAFISGAPQKRERSLAIWREVGRRLLGNFSAADLIESFADGGLKEPLHNGKPLSYWQDKLKTPLELTRLQIEIRDLKADLKAKQTYSVGKGKKKRKKKRDKLRGLDRTEAQQRLTEAEAEYKDALEAQKLNKAKTGTIEAQIAAWDAQKDALEESTKWQQQYMQGSSAADLLANMQAGAQQLGAFNDMLGKLDTAGLSDSMMKWLWDQGPAASQIAKDILSGGKATIDAFNQTSGNLAKVADAAGQSQSTGTWVKSPVVNAVNIPGYLTSGANGPVVTNRQVTFNVTQTDPYAAAVYFDQQLRYL